MENIDNHTQPFTYAIAEDLYDLSILEEMDDNEYMVEVLTVLLLETPKELKDMKEALRAGKADIVCQKAHKLKSSAGIIQAVKLNGVLADIEAMGKKGEINNELRSLVDHAAIEYCSIENVLKMHVKALK